MCLASLTQYASGLCQDPGIPRPRKAYYARQFSSVYSARHTRSMRDGRAEQKPGYRWRARSIRVETHWPVPETAGEPRPGAECPRGDARQRRVSCWMAFVAGERCTFLDVTV